MDFSHICSFSFRYICPGGLSSSTGQQHCLKKNKKKDGKNSFFQTKKFCTTEGFWFRNYSMNVGENGKETTKYCKKSTIYRYIVKFIPFYVTTRKYFTFFVSFAPFFVVISVTTRKYLRFLSVISVFTQRSCCNF